MVGNVPLGSDHPIRVQTMTTTDTTDVKATVDQVFPSIFELPCYFMVVSTTGAILAIMWLILSFSRLTMDIKARQEDLGDFRKE